MKLSSRTSATGFTLLGLTALLGALLAVTAAGCEAVLGTSDLHDQGAGDDAGPIGDDDDGDDDGAAPTDGGTDGSHVVLDATAKEGGARDAGDAGEAGDAGDASDGAMGKEAGGGEGGAADGGPVSGASCRNNPSAMQCGADTSASCCGSDAVPGDFYFRTYDDFGDDFDEITVNGFVLDSFEVTVGRMRAYAAYLAAGGALPTVGAGKHGHLNGGNGVQVKPAATTTYESGWLPAYSSLATQGASASTTFANPPSCVTTYTAAAASTDNRPVNCVSWYDAYAFCIWDGGFLPTEAEWELAASGGDEANDYPWGDTPAPSSLTAIFGCAGESATCPSVVGAAYLGNTPTNQWDMMGNVAEWTLDDYAVDYADTLGCTDCAELNTGVSTKVDRGGAFSDVLSGDYLYPQDRGNLPVGGHSDLAGFRCAHAP